MTLLPLHRFQQKLRGEIGPVSPHHGAQFIILPSGGKQRLIFQGLKHFAPQLVKQANFPRHPVVEAELKPKAGKRFDRGGMQEHGHSSGAMGFRGLRTCARAQSSINSA